VSDVASTKITIYGINLEGTNINCTEITTVDYEASLKQIIGGMNNKDKFDGCKIVISSNGDAKIYVTELSIRGILEDSGEQGGDSEDDDLLDPTLDSSDNVFEPAKATDKVDYLSAMFQLNGIKDAYIIYNFGGQTDLQKVKLTYGDYSTDDDVIVTIKVYGLVDYGMGLGAYEEFANTAMTYGEETQTIDVDMKGTTCQMFKLVMSSNGNANIGIAEAQFYGTTTKDSGDTDGISTISVTTSAAQRYSLDGRRVDSNYKGTVIENGKKIFVK
jgi:hypothetical protein